MVVKVWGARGSVPCPGPRTVKYGGNTSCVEVRCAGHRIVLDGGTGIRELGAAMATEPPGSIDVLLTHFHLDHIVGLPFWSAAYVPENRIVFRAAKLEQSFGLRMILHKMMSPPLFPIPLDEFRAQVSFEEFPCGGSLELVPGVLVETRPLNHPGGACGYRITHGGRTMAYVTDTEHVPGQDDANVLDLMRGADLAFYDATYTEAELPAHTGWGHSTWQEAVRLAELAGVSTLVLFHHDPKHEDADLDRIEAAAAAVRPGTVMAREGAEFTL
jgi:phosphoribosyl 1,2-cyclic phosphodiesterase